MAVIYSKLGGCLGDTAKLGPLARTDLCAGVKGLLDRLMTHFGLGSSGEDPWGSLLGGRSGVAFLGTSAVCLGALCLAECLCLPNLLALLEGGLLSAWGRISPAGGVVVASLPAWEEVLTLGGGTCLIN